MIKVKNPADCCGCTACVCVCKHKAIQMKPDALGFMYPEVDVAKCVNCGLCERVCAFNDGYETPRNFPQPQAYGVRHKDIEEVMKSRSGAAFVAISDYVLDRGGVVYGAGYSDHFRVVHKRATTKSGRDEFRGSKYVQSDLSGVFSQIDADLKNGQMVLFTGTPCQTAALNRFVGESLRRNLVLVDVICHGVPSPFIWRDYLSLVEKKRGGEVTHVEFRDKVLFGWSAHRESFTVDNVRSGIGGGWFTDAFYMNIMQRHSCGNCHFCNLRRPSDITLGDFWGWEKLGTEINADNKGVSLVLVNTPVGRRVFDAIEGDLTIVETSVEAYMQPNLQCPSRTHPLRNRFEEDYRVGGFDKVASLKYDARPLWRKVASYIKHNLIGLK